MNYAFRGAEVNPDIKICSAAPGIAEEDIGKLQGAVPVIYTDYKKMLDREKPDIAVIASHFYINASIAIECMNRGIHCFTEKPAAISFSDLDLLEKTQKSSGVKFCAMHALRYEPAILAAHEAVKNGLIGIPWIINAQKSYKLGTRPDFFKKRSTYGGTILWVGIHALDWIYWFSQSPVIEINAGHTAAGNSGFSEMESSCLIFLRMQNNAHASCSLDYFRPAGALTHDDDRLRIAGEKGIIEVREKNALVLLHDQKPFNLPLSAERSIFSEFAESIAGESKLLTGADEIFTVTRLALYAREAADKKQPVFIS